MNKFKLALAGILLASVAGTVFASGDEEYEDKCKAWAQEDEVVADKLDEYIQDCIKQLKDEQSSSSGG